MALKPSGKFLSTELWILLASWLRLRLRSRVRPWRRLRVMVRVRVRGMCLGSK